MKGRTKAAVFHRPAPVFHATGLLNAENGGIRGGTTGLIKTSLMGIDGYLTAGSLPSAITPETRTLRNKASEDNESQLRSQSLSASSAALTKPPWLWLLGWVESMARASREPESTGGVFGV